MLIAQSVAGRIDAATAVKGARYFCPNCSSEVILKQGRIVIHHFAHKPPTTCAWASGETRAHLEAKTFLRDHFRNSGYEADFEVELLSGAGDRRADVLVTNSRGQRVAIEVQHTPISYEAIEARTRSYVHAHVPVIWLGLLSQSMKDNAYPVAGGLEIEKYVARPWEKWVHAYCYKQIWYFDVTEKKLWQGTLHPYTIDVQSTSWYSEYGEEQSGGGYSKISKQWKTLELHGPFSLPKAYIKITSRKPWSSKIFELPGGVQALLQHVQSEL